MNLFDTIQQWLETSIVKPLTERMTRHDKDIETLAQRLLKVEEVASKRQANEPPTDLSFLAQRIHTLEQKQVMQAEELLKRIRETERNAVTAATIKDVFDTEISDTDEFRDRIRELVLALIENDDELREEIKEVNEEYLEEELNNLAVEVKRR